MKALRFSFFVVAAVACIVTAAYAVIIRERPTAMSNGSDIVLRWSTVDENSVDRFEVLRRTGTTGDFIILAVVGRKGNNSTYEYVDRSVFKASSGIYQYKIRVINGDNPAPETDVVTVSHLSTTAKRTWGSIKAMFR